MRIDKNKYKCLDMLKEKVIVCDNTPSMIRWMKDTVSNNVSETHQGYLGAMIPYIRRMSSKNIYMVSNTLWEAAMKNEKRMMDMVVSDWLKEGSGTILLPDGGMVMYFVHTISDEENAKMQEVDYESWSLEKCKGMAIMVLFGKSGCLVDACLSSVRLYHEGNNEYRLMHDAPNIRSNMFGSSVLSLLAFMQYAETETVVIENGGKKKHNDEVLQNASGFRVKYYDSRWIREIVRTEGFKVSGHFRLQRVGKNLQERKLIYINEFEKHGYHRRALKDIG